MHGTVDFSEATFSGGTVLFGRATFSGSRVFFVESEGPAPAGLLEAVGYASLSGHSPAGRVASCQPVGAGMVVGFPGNASPPPR
jgi:hypothetical protein